MTHSMHEARSTATRFRHRSDERPRLVIEFNAEEHLQQFIDDIQADLKSPAPGRLPLWRNVAAWSTGGALQ
jgi:hypothetical protein